MCISEKMNFYRLAPDVQLRVRLRYNYAWRKYRDMQAADFLTSLSPSLSSDIATTLYLHVLRGVQLLLWGGWMGRTCATLRALASALSCSRSWCSASSWRGAGSSRWTWW